MADLELRSVTVTVAQERIQIRTDLPDAELGEIIAFIDERFKRYEKYQMDYKKRLSLLAVELALAPCSRTDLGAVRGAQEHAPCKTVL